MTPDWHDYPTGPGLWVKKTTWCNGKDSFLLLEAREGKDGEFVNEYGGKIGRSTSGSDWLEPEIYRYYGPLPHDPQDQGETS